ncbi:MAG: STAS domain-containing protein [Burkholderiales bacterium]|nr:STAS domain-containing protein [Burkholderiales bacterium]
MALFSKPPAKKPEAAKPNLKPAAAGTRAPVSAREVAVQAQGRRAVSERPRAQPEGDFTVTGTSLVDWSPMRTSIEVAQANPGLCAVLENAALLYASGQTAPARTMLEQGVQNDADAKVSALAWLALFDLLQRSNDRAAFDRLALQYVVQFERSPPAWEDGAKTPLITAKATAGGYVQLTGKLTAASAPQVDSLRRAMAKATSHARLDLAQVAGFDDAGAHLLADALAEVRRLRCALTLQRPEKIRAALDILLRRGRDAGEGPWLLSLEFLQFDGKQEAFEDRAIEYAVAFEQSPPSWDPPPMPEAEALVVDSPDATADSEERTVGAGVELIAWSGVMTGSATQPMAKLSEYAYAHPVVPIDMSEVERVDFVCAGALLNAINRVETQRKAVQIVGASPIIRALLLLIGISPRHFLKKPQ